MSELIERIVELQNDFIFGRSSNLDFIQRYFFGVLAVSKPKPASGASNQDVPHGFGGRVKKMPAAFPTFVLVAQQAQVRLMDECGRLERLSWRLE